MTNEKISAGTKEIESFDLYFHIAAQAHCSTIVRRSSSSIRIFISPSECINISFQLDDDFIHPLQCHRALDFPLKLF